MYLKRLLAFLCCFIPTGRTMQSGFCTYPEYRFRANRLQELDPEGYAGYLKNFERRCSA